MLNASFTSFFTENTMYSQSTGSLNLVTEAVGMKYILEQGSQGKEILMQNEHTHMTVNAELTFLTKLGMRFLSFKWLWK